MKNTLFKALNTGTKKPIKKKRETLIGFFVDAEFNSQIVLMALGQGVSKSQLVRSIVSDWLKDKDGISILVSYLLEEEWDFSDKEFSDKEFNEKLEELLRGKGVSEDDLTEVLSRIKKLK